MNIELKTGQRGHAEKVVAYQDTAKAVASGGAAVFSTPSLIALMENAAFALVQPQLPKGYTTVGVRIDAKHLAATPVGGKVRAEARLENMDGRALTFQITAYDEHEKIGEATHVRVIVDESRFMQKVREKAERT